MLYQNFDLGVGFIPLYTIDMVQIFLWKNTTSVRHGVGEFIGVIEDEIHPGYDIASGTEWDGPITSDTLSVIDVSSVSSTSYLLRESADYVASSFGYSGTPLELLHYPTLVTFNTDQFTSSVKTSLANVGRASMDFDDLWGTIGISNGVTSESIESLITQNYILDASDVPYL